MTKTPLRPTPALLAKLGSLIVHQQLAATADGPYADRIVMQVLLEDPEVKEWLWGMAYMGFVTTKPAG